MSFFNFLLRMELKTVGSNSIYFTLTSIVISLILMILLWSQNIHIFICAFVGFLIFWERLLVFKIKNTTSKL